MSKPQRGKPRARQKLTATESAVVTAHNLAKECVDVARRFLVAAKAPAVHRMDSSTVSAIEENLSAFGPIQYLLEPLRVVSVQGPEAYSKVPASVWANVSSGSANVIDPWSDSYHELAFAVIRSLIEEIRLVEPSDALFSDATLYPRRGEAILRQLRENWSHRDLNCSAMSRRLLDEFLQAQTASKIRVDAQDSKKIKSSNRTPPKRTHAATRSLNAEFKKLAKRERKKTPRITCAEVFEKHRAKFPDDDRTIASFRKLWTEALEELEQESSN